ncbi:hypothetical protein [Aquibacillus kalidii]|uniref:hypothetical protein n=1 Tax=Aquibacillus kalidii TaxID=2762597 RepID=UPI001647D75F|nr:hypothetical protein [Aquibacillus kalidii]
MIYVLIFLIGFGLAVSGGVSIILYLNFIPAGLSLVDYFVFVQGQFECYLLIAGILIMGIAISKISNITVK